MHPTTRRPRFHPLRLGALALTLLVLAGCQSYKLGHPAELPFATIFVEPAQNQSFAPQAQALVSAKVRQAILRDSRVTLVADRAKADVTLAITLTDYQRIAASRDSNDTEVALDYDLTLQALLSLRDQNSGSYLFENRPVEARRQAFVNDVFAPAAAPDTQGFVQAEYQAMPGLADDLATAIANLVLGAW